MHKHLHLVVRSEEGKYPGICCSYAQELNHGQAGLPAAEDADKAQGVAWRQIQMHLAQLILQLNCLA